jgi:hypothetical protein
MKLPEKSVALTLTEQYCDGYNRRDLPFILSLFSKNCNLWGTALDEYRVGHKELQLQHQRDWEQSEQGKIMIMSVVPAPSDANWAAIVAKAIVTIEGQEHIFDHLRGTIIASKENGLWKISHMHCSFPDYRSQANSSFPEQN